jgi:hypothetical protein
LGTVFPASNTFGHLGINDLYKIDEDGHSIWDAEHGSYERDTVGNHVLTAHNMEMLCLLERTMAQQVYETEDVHKIRDWLSPRRTRSASLVGKMVA